MTSFGILTSPTEYSMSSTELAQWMEAKGFESIWFPEHSHIPTSRRTPFHGGGELPEQYKEFFDPFVGLTAAAAVTSKLKLGTGVCIVPEHNVINLAKAIACLDRVSNGRFILGIGAGWNAEEMADHGADFKDRWKVTRETVLAMKEIWTRDIAEYHGKFVDFDPMWCRPKPVQKGGPPILLGAQSKWALARVAEYCDGWIPLDRGTRLVAQINGIRMEMAKAGRSAQTLDLSVLTDLPPGRGLEARIPELVKVGFNRIIFMIPIVPAEKQRRILDAYAKMTSTLAH